MSKRLTGHKKADKRKSAEKHVLEGQPCYYDRRFARRLWRQQPTHRFRVWTGRTKT